MSSAAAAAIAVSTPAPAWRRTLPDAAARAEEAARAALAALPRAVAGGNGPIEISVVLGDDAMIRTLNRRWRGRDAATNVLAFASGETAMPGQPLLVGDVVLAHATVAREAAAQGKTLADHLAHLVVHGVLHLFGFDHEKSSDAVRMETLERRILARMGIADPYRERVGSHG